MGGLTVPPESWTTSSFSLTPSRNRGTTELHTPPSPAPPVLPVLPAQPPQCGLAAHMLTGRQTTVKPGNSGSDLQSG